MRTQRTEVNSYLTFYLSGFTLYGSIQIGMPGSGFCNVFYSMSTPIDEENTRLYVRFYFSAWRDFRSCASSSICCRCPATG